MDNTLLVPSIARHRVLGLALLSGWLLLSGPARSQAGSGGEVTEKSDALIATAFPSGLSPQKDGRVLFTTVLDSPKFRHSTAGPFTIYALASDPETAASLVADARVGLAPLQTIPGLLGSAAHDDAGQDAEGVAQAAEATGGAGIPGPTQYIVLTRSVEDYERVLALLDRCEDLGFSGWKPLNPLWTPESRAAEVARTWEVQVFNLQHPTITARSKEWLQHGLGYYTLAHLVNRAVRLDAWGLSPPWFDQGLIDELDIQAYGQSWVGAESWVRETSGWFRPGWSGFLPEGMTPPEPPSGPPLDLATKVKKTGDPWADREKSAERHWGELVEDRRSASPASFAYMAEHQSFLPRDRAYARCALHMLLALGRSGGGQDLLASLGAQGTVAPDGMLDSEPLTVIVSRALGGVPEVESFEALPLADVLVETRRPDIADRLTELEADGLLALTDHREQSRWLYEKWEGQMAYRGEVFRLIMEAEQGQQLHEWELIGRYLDRGMAGLLSATPSYPASDAALEKALAAFRTGFTHEIEAPPPAAPEKSAGKGAKKPAPSKGKPKPKH